MNSLGREDKEDFGILYELVTYVNELCYEKWKIPLGSHSEQVYNNMREVQRIIEETESKVNELDQTRSPAERLAKSTDFYISVEYRNGINLALDYLVKINKGVLLEPDMALY